MDRPKEARRSWRSCGSVGSAIREVQLEARRSACGPGPQQPGVEGTQDKGLQGWREPRSWITTLLRWPAIAMPLTTMEQPDRTSNAKWGTGRVRLFFRKMSERKRFCLILVAGSRITRNVNLLMAGGMPRATWPLLCDASIMPLHSAPSHPRPRLFSPVGKEWAGLVPSLPREAEGGSEDVHYPVPECPWGRPHHRE